MYIKRKVFSKKDSASTNATIGAGAGAAGVTGASALAAGSIKAKKLADKMEKKRAEEGKAIMEKVKAKEKEVTHTIYPNREKAKKAEECLFEVHAESVPEFPDRIQCTVYTKRLQADIIHCHPCRSCRYNRETEQDKQHICPKQNPQPGRDPSKQALFT